MTTPSLIDLMTHALARGAAPVPESASVPESACRFPVVVSPESRAFLDSQTVALQQSLASLCGLIIDEVVRETRRRHDGQQQLRRKHAAYGEAGAVMIAPQNIIAGLELGKAPTDTVRASVLDALVSYAKATGLPELGKAAREARPAAHPFRPPKEWRERYLAAFAESADPDCGVDPDEGPRYCVEYWQGLTDSQRRQRLAEPWLGEDDGQKDADDLNAA